MARRSRKKAAEHENLERWLVSYADFITLLFAFFVVMYAISSVNVGKYRVLSESLVAAFHNVPHSLDPIQVGKVAATGPPATTPMQNFPAPMEMKGLPQTMMPAPVLPPRQAAALRSAQAPDEQLANTEAAIRAMGKEIQRRLGNLIDQKLVSVNIHRLWIDIKINTDFLFSSGSIQMPSSATSIIKEVARALAPLPNRIQVEGFTDDIPIHSLEFPSNWELSAARAASVVRLMAEFGVAPQRMAAVGYGQYRPVASNATAAGRSQNRRVDLVVLASGKTLEQAGAAGSPALFQRPGRGAQNGAVKENAK
ncbi:flagellar motor protein MotD [Acidihalobacter prosperus]|uniref:Flagellar motor rotation protein MotB n=1 Tax=Acidihalobacter prosperus TaxID=160660 RepID=A0A1A6C5G1_9GAMM|nr:flagellar motor protein MotD [Acidihalobacter prosperus]OBS09798.1 Flagellar motor rotation protein MotB [Acidihalobacter prosperus]